MKYYFAYGSNMSSRRVGQWCRFHRLVGRATLSDRRFIINVDALATIVPDPESNVIGVLWEINSQDEVSLDIYEGVEHGLYTKETVVVSLSDGATVEALVYVASEDRVGFRRIPDYMKTILEGAREAGLPEAYLRQVGLLA